MNKKIMLITLLLASLLLVSSASAYIKLCLLYGESIPNATNWVYKCRYDQCNICVTEQLYPASPNSCNDQAACQHLIDLRNTTVVTTMTVSSPVDNSIYNTSGVMFNMTAGDSRMKFTFRDNLHPERGWQTLCTSCSSVATKRTLTEGYNSVTVMGTDLMGRSQTQEFTFRIDSVKPLVSGTTPAYGAYTNGLFNVKYTEANLQSVTLQYKANGSMTYTNVTSTTCLPGKANCSIILPDLAQGKVYYSFFLKDYKGTTQSREAYGIVDTLAPVLTVNSPRTGTYNFTSHKFNLTTTELVKISYIDYNVSRPTWSTLCTSCSKLVMTKSLAKGSHRIQIKAEDKALNYDMKEITVNVV